MKKFVTRFFKFPGLVSIIIVLVVMYQARLTRASVPVDYQVVFYDSLENQSTANYFAAHDCSVIADFRSCPEDGLAFQVDKVGLIREVYFYVQLGNGFVAYSGKLPFGILPTDTMTDVQQKLGHPKVPQVPTLGWEPGLPTSGGTPDHVHYWAVYEQYHLTIVYNSPLADDLGAGIYMILISVDPIESPQERTLLL